MHSRKSCSIDNDEQRCNVCNRTAQEIGITPGCPGPPLAAYASIDIETTGLDFDNNQVLEFGAVLDDLQNPIDRLPQFQRIVLQRDEYYGGSAYALSLNAGLMKQISEIHMALAMPGQIVETGWCFEDELAGLFHEWLVRNHYPGEKLLCAGKNFASFDRIFLSRIPGWEEQIPMHHRCLDPMNLFYDPLQDRHEPPGMGTCLQRAGIDKQVEHTALADALDVVQLIRKGYDIV